MPAADIFGFVVGQITEAVKGLLTFALTYGVLFGLIYILILELDKSKNIITRMKGNLTDLQREMDDLLSRPPEIRSSPRDLDQIRSLEQEVTTLTAAVASAVSSSSSWDSPEPTIRVLVSYDGTDRHTWPTFRVAIEDCLTVDWKCYASAPAALVLLRSATAGIVLEHIATKPRPTDTTPLTSADAVLSSIRPLLDELEQTYGLNPTTARSDSYNELTQLWQDELSFTEFYTHFSLLAVRAAISPAAHLSLLQLQMYPALRAACLTRTGPDCTLPVFVAAALDLDLRYRPENTMKESNVAAVRVPAGAKASGCWGCGAQSAVNKEERKRHNEQCVLRKALFAKENTG